MSAGSGELCLSLQLLRAPPRSQTMCTWNFHLKHPKSSDKIQGSSRWITSRPQAVAATQEDANASVEMPGKCPIADKGFPGISSLIPREKKVPSSQATESAFALHIICKQNHPVCPRPARSGGSEIRCHYQVLLLWGHKVVPSEQPSELQTDEEDNLIPSLEMSDFMGE